MSRLACVFSALVASTAAAGSNVHDRMHNVSTSSSTGRYRMWFTKTFGETHMCLTEIAFYGGADNNTRLEAALVSMTSCYGCSSCTGCEHRYGKPQVMFDGKAESDAPEAWFCTAPGTFSREGVGSQKVMFTLPSRPAVYVLQRPQVNGEWVTQAFSLEEELSDGSWLLLDEVVDAEKALDQRYATSDAPKPVLPVIDPWPSWSYATPELWAKDYPACGASQQSPINLDAMTGAAAKQVLPYSYQPLSGRALANTGTAAQVAGNFGNLTLPDGVYAANQFHFHFPPEHRIGGDDHLAVGELRIVHQKIGSRGTDDLAMVSIMLHLPLESEDLTAQEQFFIDIGMLGIPPEGTYTHPFKNPVDLSIFADQLNGNYWHYVGSLTAPPCTPGVKWFIMESYAVISGIVVEHFKKMFPDPSNARPLQGGDRVVSINTLEETPRTSV